MKTIIAMVLCLLSFEYARAQEQWVGLKAGMDRTRVSSDHYSGVHSRPGVTAGISFERVTRAQLLMGVELLYEQRGFSNEVIITDYYNNPTGEYYPVHFKYNYVTMPLKMGLYLKGRFFGYACAGLLPGILIKATEQGPVLDGSNQYQRDTLRTITNRMPGFDLGGLVEVGMGYKVTKHLSVVGSCRAQQSFTSFTSDNYFTGYSVKHNGVAVCIGVKYALIKAVKDNTKGKRR
jgi:hypothetical protein